MKLSTFAVKKPIATLMVIIGIVVVGIISWRNIPLLFFPEFSGSSLRIEVAYKSSSPGEIEDLITRPIEEIMGTVKHLVTMKSTSSSNIANITLEFKLGTNMDLAALEVETKLEQVKKELPKDMDRMQVFRFQSTDMPVIMFSISCKGDRARLYDIAEKIQREILRIDGIAGVEISGMNKKQLLVELDRERVQTHHIEPYTLRQTLLGNNVNISAGEITEGDKKYIVRAVGEFNDEAEIAQLPLKKGLIRLSDVADVSYSFVASTNYQRLNSNDAVALYVMKTSTANIVSVAKAVKRTLNELKRGFSGDNLQILIFRDRSKEIVERLASLRNNGVYGGVLVIIILYLFLRNVRSTLIISMAIPASVLCTFTIIFMLRKFFGSDITINVISLMGLILSVGMLVDPAIVVLQNIHRHKETYNIDAKQAAILGSSEVGLALLAASATTMCVFAPMIFLPKTMWGIFMHDFGATVCIAIGASLLVGLTLIPLAGSRILIGKEREPFRYISTITRLYTRLIKVTLRYRWITIAGASALLAVSFYVYKHLEREWVPRPMYREVRIRVDTPKSYDIQQTRRLFIILEDTLKTKKDELEIATISSSFDRGGGMLDAYLTDENVAKRPISAIADQLKASLPEIPGVRYTHPKWYSASQERGIALELKGRNPETLAKLAKDVKQTLQAIPELKDLDVSVEKETDEFLAYINRNKAHKYGLSPQRVAFGVMGALSGRSVGQFKKEGRQVDINIQLKEEDRQNLDQLKNLALDASNANNVALGTLVDFEQRKGPMTIEHLDRQPVVKVTGTYSGVGIKKLYDSVFKAMSSVSLPAGYSWSMGEDYRRYKEDEAGSRFGLTLALALIYIIMASLFESFIHPFTIMLSIPFAFTGVAFSFYLLNIPLDKLTETGLLLLCGVVVNNAIVLIDYINRLRSAGMDTSSAIIKGGCDRLQPILMTALTTILGISPMVIPLLLPGLFGPLEGREGMWAPMGLLMLAGLTTSTFLTLIILPTVYSLMDSLSNLVKRLSDYALKLTPHPNPLPQGERGLPPPSTGRG
ncbi:MAG TPA: efflux RND transporter permease subunit [Candidatus Brocadiia bacterium]|nr:efflux RND transporter permease subunit [Candidatus Brocadiales bacterium]